MKVSELLDKPEKWCKGADARDADGAKCELRSSHACQWCLLGAIQKCYADFDDVADAIERLRKYTMRSISVFNDSLDTTFHDIRRVIEAAGI